MVVGIYKDTVCSEIEKLFDAFPGAFIANKSEFIATGNGEYASANAYIQLSGCEDATDIKAKVLEYMSRPATSAMPFGERKNKKFHADMLACINNYLGTKFTAEEMEDIYCVLGNGIRHRTARKFVAYGYRMSVIRSALEKNG